MFHGALLDASRHSQLVQPVAHTIAVPLVFRAFRHFDRDALARSAAFHHLIFEAARRQDPTRAGRRMAEHVLQGGDAVLARMAGIDSGTPSPGDTSAP